MLKDINSQYERQIALPCEERDTVFLVDFQTGRPRSANLFVANITAANVPETQTLQPKHRNAATASYIDRCAPWYVRHCLPEVVAELLGEAESVLARRRTWRTAHYC
jgi:hypothetical protein